jgi:hypothetical protein
MLGNAQFYNRTIRKVVVAFGTLFNDIQLQRYTKDGTVKKEIFKVPLSYGSKERYLTQITSDPSLTINVTVPRISFELTGMSYDASRKLVSTLKNFSYSETDGFKTQYAPVPYDFSFSMSIFVRNTEDGTQIVEQILPFFTPDFTVTVNFINDMSQKYDMPIILNSVNVTTDYEGGMADGSTRLIIWDLEFTAKAFIWPIVKKDQKGLIGAYSNVSSTYGEVKTNIYVDNQDRNAQKVLIDYANGNNYFITAETIRVQERDVTGRVIYFSNSNNNILIVGELNRLLQANDVVVGDYTNATYKVNSVDLVPFKAASIITRAVPQNSGPDDEFGFSETITEWPDTL